MSTKFTAVAALAAGAAMLTYVAASAAAEPVVTHVGSSVAARSTDDAGRATYYTDGRWYYADGTPAPATAGGRIAQHPKQRVAITARAGRDRTHAPAHLFVLSPLKAGAVARDSGISAGCVGCFTHHFVTRDGQKIEINNKLFTLAGKHGTLDIRFRTEWADAGNGYSVGTGTWKVVGGTGNYRGVTGSGRSAFTWIAGAQMSTSWRADGFLSQR